jgi:hypothetical protein
MKTKNQAPHDEIKSYLKVAKEKIGQAFFTRPEWRHPKTAGGVNVIISRLNEAYYPFSDKKYPKLAVWKQVLKEKREEMIEEIEAAKKLTQGALLYDPDPKKLPGAGIDCGMPTVSQLPKVPPLVINTYGDINAEEIANKISSAFPWPPARIEQLKADIKHRRIASEIARRLKVDPSFIGWVLTKGSKKSQNLWLPKINQEFNQLVKPALDAKCDTTEAKKNIEEVKSQFNKDDINHKNFMGQEYPQGPVKPDSVPLIKRLEEKGIEDMLELVGSIYRMIEGMEFKGTTFQKRQIIGAVAQLIDPNLVLTRQS